MKKRMRHLMSLALVTAMVVPMAACGGSSSGSASSESASGSSAAASSSAASSESASEAASSASSTAAVSSGSAAAAAGDEGKVLNIEVWNNEFPNRLADHYPGFEAADPEDATKGGKIGDVTVNFILTDNQDNKYQTKLDEDLSAQADASDDDKVDLFLIEADYALKYVDADADVAMPLKDLGITDDDLSKQFQYTKDIVTDANGDIRGSSCSAGGMLRGTDLQPRDCQGSPRLG
jgi:hypothetical protein